MVPGVLKYPIGPFGRPTWPAGPSSSSELAAASRARHPACTRTDAVTSYCAAPAAQRSALRQTCIPLEQSIDARAVVQRVCDLHSAQPADGTNCAATSRTLWCAEQLWGLLLCGSLLTTAAVAVLCAVALRATVTGRTRWPQCWPQRRMGLVREPTSALRVLGFGRADCDCRYPYP